MGAPSFRDIIFPWKILSGPRPVGLILLCSAFSVIPVSILGHVSTPTLEEPNVWESSYFVGNAHKLKNIRQRIDFSVWSGQFYFEDLISRFQL